MYANVKSRNGGVMTSWLMANFRALASSGEYDLIGAEPLLIPEEYVICPLVVRCTLCTRSSSSPYQKWKNGP